MLPRRQSARGRGTICKGYEDEFRKATEKLQWDWRRMVKLYRYPREHWVCIRTTNVVESPFSATRLIKDRCGKEV